MERIQVQSARGLGKTKEKVPHTKGSHGKTGKSLRWMTEKPNAGVIGNGGQA